LKEAALGLEHDQLERRLVGRRRFNRAPKTSQQVSADGVQQMIAPQLSARVDCVSEK